MARHKKAWRPEPDEPGLDISSLIDICFLLLIYFLVTSTLVQREKDLKMDLPSTAPSDEIAKLEPLFITVRSDGAIIEGTESPLYLSEDKDDRMVQAVYERLNTYRQTAEGLPNTTPVVQIYVEDGAIQQRVVDVLNALSRARIKSITFTDLLNE